MDYQQTLKQIFNGSRSQRKRKQELDKKKKELLTAKKKDEEKIKEITNAQFRYIHKIKEGLKNSRRTVAIRLFFLRFQNKTIFERGKRVQILMKEFEKWILEYEYIINQNTWKKENEGDQRIIPLLQKLEKEKKELEQFLNQEENPKDKAAVTFFLIILTSILLLFKETKEVEYNKEIFDEKNRANPLNPFYPLRI